MDQPSGQNNAARSNQDVALDLLKFVASTTGVGRTASGSTGFTAPSSAKAEDQAEHLLELYGRCLDAVQGKSATR